MEKEKTSIDYKAIGQMSQDELLYSFGTRLEGLTQQEVLDRLARDGYNQLKEAKQKSLIQVLLGNFSSLMALLLWASGIIAFIAGMPELGLAVWAVNLINGLFSFMQEFKASKATAALKQMLPATCKVRRNNEDQQILAKDLVVHGCRPCG